MSFSNCKQNKLLPFSIVDLNGSIVSDFSWACASIIFLMIRAALIYSESPMVIHSRSSLFSISTKLFLLFIGIVYSLNNDVWFGLNWIVLCNFLFEWVIWYKTRIFVALERIASTRRYRYWCIRRVSSFGQVSEIFVQVYYMKLFVFLLELLILLMMTSSLVWTESFFETSYLNWLFDAILWFLLL